MSAHIADHWRQQLAEELSKDWACWWVQDGSFDVCQNENYFNMVRSVDFKTGKLKTKFVGLQEQEGHGAEGQKDCMLRAILSLFPDQKEITFENLNDLIVPKYNNDNQNEEKQ